MSADGEVGGHVDWVVEEVATGHRQHGQREVRSIDIEVRVSPPPPRPSLERLRLGPPQLIADVMSRLMTGGRATQTKRLRLGGGFWLVLPEHPGPGEPRGTALEIERDGERTHSWEWFDADGGTTARQRDGSGVLEVEWAGTPDGYREVASTTFVNDVSLRLGPRRAGTGLR